MRLLIAAASVAVLFGCSSQSANLSPTTPSSAASDRDNKTTPIRHVVVIIQENRSFDNLFNGFPGANTVRQGQNSKGKTVPLQSIDITAPYDLSHKHRAWFGDYDNGKMDGFNLETENCLRKKSRCPAANVAAYAYVPKSEIMPYWTLASQYTIADEMFESSEGPSFPAHQYLISGTSAVSNYSSYKASENAADEADIGHQGGCDSLPSTTVETIDPDGNEGNPVFPCFERTSIMDLLDQNSVSWRFYQAFGGAGQWHAVDAIKQIWEGKKYKQSVEWPSSTVLKDIKQGRLASVVYVTPTAQESDHPGVTDGSGPSWVGSIVNDIGESKYWDSTAILVTWDDWGGWYEHFAPTIYNSFELGFRVPMLVISPYAKTGYVSHVPYEFGSILKFVEETFDLPSLGTTDRRANDLSDCFNFTRSPRRFKPVHTKYSAQYFLKRPVDYQSPDTDF